MKKAAQKLFLTLGLGTRLAGGEGSRFQTIQGKAAGPMRAEDAQNFEAIRLGYDMNKGFTHTERAERNLKAVPGMATQLNKAAGTSVEFPGPVIAALAADPDIIKRSGGTFISPELAAEYGITDTDGRVIPSLRAERGAPIFGPI